MMKTIYLHIGQTKTATTTLQAFFHDNRDWLANRGVYYLECPPEHKIQAQHRFLAESLAGIPLPMPERVAEWTYLRGKIEETTHDRILISEEVFWHIFEHRREEKIQVIDWIRKQLAEYDVRIICYLRRQDKWIESWYNQIVKTDVTSHARMTYAEFIDIYRQYGLLDYNAALRPWEEVFGRENMIVRPFERRHFLDGDIISDFLRILSLRLDDQASRPKDKQVSLCNSACELSYIFNNTSRAREFKQKFRSLITEYDATVEDHRRFTPIEVARELLNEFAESNSLLSDKYCDSDLAFFSDTLSGYEAGEYPGLSVRELAAFMMYAFEDMQGQIRALRRKLNESD